MKDEAYEAEKARIEGFYARWRSVLGLDGWDVARSYFDGEYVKGHGETSDAAAGSASVRWEYRHATLSFNVQNTRDLDDAEMEAIVVHECMHILLHEMRDDTATDIKHEERVATSLAWAFMRTTPKEISG